MANSNSNFAQVLCVVDPSNQCNIDLNSSVSLCTQPQSLAQGFLAVLTAESMKICAIIQAKEFIIVSAALESFTDQLMTLIYLAIVKCNTLNDINERRKNIEYLALFFINLRLNDFTQNQVRA